MVTREANRQVISSYLFIVMLATETYTSVFCGVWRFGALPVCNVVRDTLAYGGYPPPDPAPPDLLPPAAGFRKGLCEIKPFCASQLVVDCEHNY